MWRTPWSGAGISFLWSAQQHRTHWCSQRCAGPGKQNQRSLLLHTGPSNDPEEVVVFLKKSVCLKLCRYWRKKWWRTRWTQKKPVIDRRGTLLGFCTLDPGPSGPKRYVVFFLNVEPRNPDLNRPKRYVVVCHDVHARVFFFLCFLWVASPLSFPFYASCLQLCLSSVRVLFLKAAEEQLRLQKSEGKEKEASLIEHAEPEGSAESKSPTQRLLSTFEATPFWWVLVAGVRCQLPRYSRRASDESFYAREGAEEAPVQWSGGDSSSNLTVHSHRWLLVRPVTMRHGGVVLPSRARLSFKPQTCSWCDRQWFANERMTEKKKNTEHRKIKTCNYFDAWLAECKLENKRCTIQQGDKTAP